MPEELQRRMHKTIKKVGEDTENLKFNTAISEMMVFVNELQKAGSVFRIVAADSAEDNKIGSGLRPKPCRPGPIRHEARVLLFTK